MKDDILIPLASGFEELEAITLIDVLRRAELSVVVANLGADGPGIVQGAHGIGVETDQALGALEHGRVGAVILPGGMPGAVNLREDAELRQLLREVHGRGGCVGAICAAPIALAAAGLLEGLEATCYPGFEDQLEGARVVRDRSVVRAERVWTSRGPGTALEFALALVSEFVGAAPAEELRSGMLVGSVS